GLDVEKLGWLQKKMIGMVAKQILQKPESERSPAERDMLAAQRGPVDFSDMAAAQPLIDWCKGEIQE
ncbi:MAG: hypothetical protein PHD32_07565, partial [Eubacteriales bacterium]|nr:hypothetical protein [Eubacteriales bacterium]